MKYVLSAFLLAAGLAASADYRPEKKILDARQAFAEQRFGVFIHWGLYSTYAQGEWYLESGKLDEAAYSRAMYGFCPSRFDAEEWVRAIRGMGAKYITITSRHHEGFSLWPTKVDDGYNIANTPFRRDILGELAAACRREGVQLNFYYSLLDWHRPFMPPGFRVTLKREGRKANEDYAAYKRYMMGQLAELCDGYKPGLIWFDGEWGDIKGSEFDWGLDELYDLVHAKGVLVASNSHLPVRPKEDIQLFERDLPGENASGFSAANAGSVATDRPVEQCDVIQDNVWGYRIEGKAFRTAEDVVAMVARAAAKNANLLMNIGPDGSGQLPAKALEVMAEVGKWFEKNGESIYATTAGGVALAKDVVSTRKGNVLYLHFLNPSVNEIAFPLKGEIVEAQVLADVANVTVRRTASGDAVVTVRRPEGCKIDIVVKLTVKTPLDAYVERFNATDEELYTNAIPNSAAAAFLANAVPLFACPDRDIERTYYFRWWTYRKHLRKRKSDGGWVVTEFLPDVGWAGAENTISCPFGHHVREGRWLRDAKYVESYLEFMLAKGRINGVGSYCCWPATSALELEEVTGRCALADSLLERCVANFERWSEGWNVWGLSLQGVNGCDDYTGVTIRSGWRAERGLYDFVGNYEGSEFALSAEGARPLVNAAMWSEAASIARIARRTGKAELADRFAKMADSLAANVRARLWNAKQGFFTTLACDGRLDDVCELNGYAPFYFGMPLPAACGAAWDRLLDEKGFRAPKGLTFPARDTPGFAVTSRTDFHECLWNGPSWPYATSIALTGLARWLQGGGETKVTRADFTALLAQYAAQQRLAKPPEEGGETVPWIDENLDPFTGEWLARKVLQGKACAGKQSGPRERGKDYNHSTFCDLVISGLVGFVPGEGESFAIDPCVPESWDYFTLERVRYRGHDVAVRWHRGQGGLTVEVDGKQVAQSDRLRRLDVKLAPPVRSPATGCNESLM